MSNLMDPSLGPLLDELAALREVERAARVAIAPITTVAEKYFREVPRRMFALTDALRRLDEMREEK